MNMIRPRKGKQSNMEEVGQTVLLPPRHPDWEGICDGKFRGVGP